MTLYELLLCANTNLNNGGICIEIAKMQLAEVIENIENGKVLEDEIEE